MGCGGSKNGGGGGGGGTAVGTQRRRLSVGEVDNANADPSTEITEEDRGIITSLNTESILSMVGDDGEGRKMSIGSQTDQAKTSFANKSIQTAGDEVDPVQLGLGYTCRKGLKPESPNQDSWFVLKLEGNFSIYAVFDGHGQKGHDVSNFVKENLPKLIVKDSRFKTAEMPKMLQDSFKKIQHLISTADRMKKLSAQMSGTTATVCVHDHGQNKLTLAHVADSTGVLGKLKGDKKTAEAIQLTRDHKPNLKDERQRIEKNGGRVVFDGYANHRVYAKNARYPGLNMSRCLGDLMGHQDCGISAEPEVLEHQVTPEDHVLLLCSDGVWEFITPAEAVTIVNEFPSTKAMVAAERLAKEAWDRWIREEGGAVVDDITVVLIYLQHQTRDS
jgi:serine/threonine protein phosphatase PrpC